MRRTVFLLLFLLSYHVLHAQYYETIATIDFENPALNFEVDIDTSSGNLWQIGTPQKSYFGDAYSSPNAILTDTINTYSVSNHSSFILKFANDYDYTETWNYTDIEFWHKFQMDSLHDYGHIYWSYDTLSYWLPMSDTCCISPDPQYPYPQWALLGWYYPLMDLSHKNFVTGVQDWTYSIYEWNWYFPVGPTDDPFFPNTIYVRFDFDSDSLFESMDGWMIDNISVDKGLGFNINEPNQLKPYLKVYPNPASTILNFALVGQESLNHVRLFNSWGKEVRSLPKSRNQSNLNVADLPDGIYLLLVEIEHGQRITTPIIIN